MWGVKADCTIGELTSCSIGADYLDVILSGREKLKKWGKIYKIVYRYGECLLCLGKLNRCKLVCLFFEVFL